MTETLRHVVVRALTDGLNEAAGFYVPEILRRDITFRTRIAGGLDIADHTLPGIVLIGADSLEPLARAVGRITLKILRTDELLWLPVQSRQDFGAWTVEAVPLTMWMRLTARSDTAILRNSGIEPPTPQPADHDTESETP